MTVDMLMPVDCEPISRTAHQLRQLCVSFTLPKKKRLLPTKPRLYWQQILRGSSACGLPLDTSGTAGQTGSARLLTLQHEHRHLDVTQVVLWGNQCAVALLIAGLVVTCTVATVSAKVELLQPQLLVSNHLQGRKWEVKNGQLL